MKTIKPSIVKPSYVELMRKQVLKAIKAFYQSILMEQDDVTNSGDPLEEALVRGLLTYKDGKFTGQFSAKTAIILKKMGAKWKKTYFEIPSEAVPARYLSAMAQGKIRDSRKIEQLFSRLNTVNVDRIAEKADVEYIVEKIISDVNKDIDKSVPTVNLQMDPAQAEQIKQKYTETTKLHIKGWAQTEIEKLRVKMGERIAAGERYENFYKEIEAQYGVSPKKAQFIARQETNLLHAEIQEQKFRKAGFNQYVWRTSGKSNVREDHAHLEGSIQDWDHPPIVNNKTGKRGHPGTDFNCFCVAQVLIS